MSFLVLVGNKRVTKEQYTDEKGHRGTVEQSALWSLGIPECMGSNLGHGLSGDWASTRGDGSQMGGLSNGRSPLGGIL